MTTFLSGDKHMYEAYNTGKDLYAMIARSAFNNNYEDNLEFYPEGTEIEIDGNKVICGHKTHLNKAGKERRSVGKVLNLAATYGMGGATAGARLGKDAKEGTKLLNNFFSEFSGVKQAIDNSKKFLKENGYVEDFVGRRRRLDDINKVPFEVLANRKGSDFNPFIGCADRTDNVESLEVWQRIIKAYVILSNIHRCRNAHKDGFAFEASMDMSRQAFDHLQKIGLGVMTELKKPWSDYYKTPVEERILTDINVVLDYYIKSDGIYRKWAKTKEGKDYVVPSTSRSAIQVKDPAIDAMVKAYVEEFGDKPLKEIPKESVILRAWTGRIAQASRQCFNARIQGSAASLTKMAMVDIYKDEKLRELDAHLVITVHDEVLVECPAYYADQVEKRLPEIMVNAAKEGGDDVPQACDPYNVSRWYADTAAASILEEFKKLEAGNPDKNIAPLPRDEALQKVIKNHIEVPEAAIIKTVETGCDLDF